MIVALDSGPVGQATNPNASPEGIALETWLTQMSLHGHDIVLPEIVDYEIRRELIRAGKTRGLRRLELLKANCTFLPITSEMMLKAAELWAQARRYGRPTANNTALDIDVILAAQLLSYARPGDDIVVITRSTRKTSRNSSSQTLEGRSAGLI